MAEQAQQRSRPHIVVVGGGFGGLNAARELSRQDVDITLIDRNNHHLFQPLLYQVAMAGLPPADIAGPIRGILRRSKNVRVLLAEVADIDVEHRLVFVRDSAMEPLAYDYLVLATGAENNYFGHDEWAEAAVGLKEVEDAIEIRHRVLLAFEEAERETDPEKRRRLLQFVVIGGGATGVELAGAMAELGRFVLARDFRNVDVRQTRVVLLEAAPRILLSFPEDLAANATRQLERLGVEVRTGAMVRNIDADGVHIEGGDFIPSCTVMWCAGVKATPLTARLGVALDRAGRVVVEPDCSVPRHPHVFVIGDAAAFMHQGGGPLPGVAPVATQMGRFVARTVQGDLLGRPRGRFVYKDKGSLATVGRSAAVAHFGRIKLTGLLAWLTWILVHVFFLIGFRNRAAVLFNWFWSYVTYQRGARLITGDRYRAGPPRLERERQRSVQQVGDGEDRSAMGSYAREASPGAVEPRS